MLRYWGTIVAVLAIVFAVDHARADDGLKYEKDPKPSAKLEGTKPGPKDVGLRERLTIAVPGGDDIAATLSLPTVGTKPYPVVLLVHGAYDDRKEQMLNRFGTRLNAIGIACIAYDLPGHGDRVAQDKAGFRRSLGLLLIQTALSRGQAVPPEIGAIPKEAATQPASQADTLLPIISAGVRQGAIDGRRVLDYVVTRSEIDASRIAVCGVSLGGTVGTLIASADDRVKVGCFLVAGARTQFADESLPEKVRQAYATVDPAKHAEKVKQPVLMLNGKSDVVVLPSDSKALFDKFAGPKEQRWYDAGHNLVRPALDDGVRWMAGHFNVEVPATQPATAPATLPVTRPAGK